MGFVSGEVRPSPCWPAPICVRAGGGHRFASPAVYVGGSVVAGLGVGLTFHGNLPAISAVTTAKSRSEVFSAVYVISCAALSLPSLAAALAAPSWGRETAGYLYVGFVGALSLGAALHAGRSPAHRPSGDPVRTGWGKRISQRTVPLLSAPHVLRRQHPQSSLVRTCGCRVGAGRLASAELSSKILRSKCLRCIRKLEEVAICMGDGHGPGGSEQEDRLGAEWERHRPAVFGVAYRLLGTVTDAEDVTQDVWLRAAGADLQAIDDLRAWLVTVAARRSYDILKSARFRRETYVGPWLPEPLLTGPDASQPVLVDESVSSAMLLIMEELSPPERVAFVLHDVFGLEFGRTAEVLDVSVPGARQLASRARRRVAKAKQSTPQASKAERQRVLTVFRAAYEAGDLAGLVRLLHPDAVYVTDGGGKVLAARKLIHGGERVAEVMVRVGRQWQPDRIEFAEVGGELALVFHREGRVYSVDTVQITDGLITAYRRVINPDKLVRV